MNLFELLLVAGSVAAGSLLKGITGVGGPILAIPVMAAFIGVEHAVVLLAIPGVLMNGWLLWQYRGATGESHHLWVMIVAGVVGAALGTWALASLDDRLLSVGLAVVIVAYLVTRLATPRFEIGPSLQRWLSPVVGVGAGVMQGSTGIAAPVVATYVHGLNLSREGYVGTVTMLFEVFAVAQVAAITAAGLYTPTRLYQSALAAVPALALLPVGDWIGQRLSLRVFNKVVLWSLAALAAKLLYDVATT